MFEGVVAYALNKYLGRFVEDLDSEQLNVGIFSGTVHLTDLHLKAEALADLELPIEVKGGCIGKISIDIPWTSLYYEPVLVHVEEVLVLAGPVYDRANDPERDKRLLRALKNRRLALAQPDAPDPAGDKPKGFIENLVTTIVNNVQVSLQNVHIRYEDGVSTGHPMSCGLVLQNLTAVTTNSKWKATQIDADAKSLFKLLKVESLSLYWNPSCPSNTLVKAQLNSDGWKTLLRRGLQTFSINGEDFDFVVKPISLKTKMILNKSKEAKVPKLLVDFVLQDAASQLSREQLLSMYELQQSFELSSMGFRFRRYFSGLTAKGQATRCWREAFQAVTEEYVRPYTWARIKEHRSKYRDYKSLYKEHLHHPTDTERRMDLQLLEDSLDLTSILAAREQAKMEIASSEPELVRNVTPRQSWTFWSWFSSSSTSTDSEPDSATTTAPPPPPSTTASEEFVVVGDRGSWWSRMTAEERQRLCEGVGYERGGEAAPPPPNYIGHKLNFTLANCTVSLVGAGREVLVLTLTHFLASLETRPGAKAFKVSARTESLVIEGASVENDLVPILTADNVTSGCNVPHVFALDFEKNPAQVNANYGLNLSVEPMEIVYHKYAVSELLEFLKLPDVGLEPVRRKAQEKLRVLVEAGRSGVVSALAKHRTVHLNVDLRSPYFVIPEHGSLQQGGSLIVVDTGRLTIKTDLQADTADAEESTKMEAEERLYDRFNVALSDIQVLFSDSGEEWRSAKLMSESEMHLVPKARLAVVFSNSVRPDCRTLPRQKLNISIPSLKLNLSDRRVSMIAEFLHSLPLRPAQASPTDITDAAKVFAKSRSDHQLCSHAIRDPNGPELQVVWKCLHRGRKTEPEERPEEKQQQTKGVLERAWSASDHSDSEEAADAAAEQWARLVDLPGFEDNVSASNCIRVLFRLVCGELAVHLARSSDHADKPYLLLRAEKLCVDAARMEYGPAVQASLHRVQLVDKLHKGSSGEYLELISSDNKADMITVLYRKVQADCPEFKSHFHQVEHSLVVDVSGLAVAFHREAFVTIARFLQYVVAKLKPRTLSKNLRLNELPRPSSLVLQEESDPPVPPGATKFSISARLDCLAVRLCDTDLELADLRVAGLEMDYVLKANEKSVLRFDLTELSLEDLLQDTLYKKILSTEGDKVIDMKYVRRSPHQKDMEANRSQDSLPVRVDGSLRLRVGRTVFVLLPTFTNELHRFLEPFLNPDTTAFVRKSTEGKLQQHVCELKQSVLRYQVSVEVGAPTLLLPQKATSPNALLLNLGQLSVENFFQEDGDRCVDNLLFRLQALQLARAVILLDGRMEIREPILEPLQLRLDVKRSLAPCQGLLYDVSGSMDLIKVNIGQRDLSSMIAIYQDNYSQLRFLDSRKDSAISPCSPSAATTPGAEESMRKLEVFLYGSTEVKKESAFTFIMEGLQLTLYTDGQDMRSLSVRDPEQALTTFSLDEVSLSLETTNDRALELKCSCQAATLLDVSAPKGSPLCKIFQSYSGDCGGSTGVEGIRLCMPPMVDLTYRQTANGDAAVDVVVEKIRLNVSVGYLLAVLKFVSDALPGSRLPSAEAFEQEDGGGVSPGRLHRLPSDSTSGYQSTAGACAGEPRALSVSAVFRKPEVVLFAQPDLPNTGVLVLKMDIMLDYSFNLGQGNTVLSVAGLHMLSCVYGRRKHTMCTVLHPCELELNRSLRLAEEDIKSSVMVSSLNLCLSAPVVDTILQVSRQLMNSIQEEENRRSYNMEKELKHIQDLWSPTAVNPQKWADSECWCHQTPFLIAKYSESLTVSVPELQVWCEVNVESKAVPLLYAKAALEADMKDWKTQLNAKGEFRLEAMYYNEKVSCWEPLLEHVLISEGHYRPIEIMFKAFRDRSHPIVCGGDDAEPIPRCATDGHRSSGSSPSSSGNETEEEEEVAMTVIRRKPIRAKRLSSIAKSRDASSLVAFPGDSDSENEDGVLEKIASTFDHLFSDGDGEPSDDDDDGDDEPHSDSEGIGADIDGDRSDDGSGDTETADHDDDAFDDGRAALPPPAFSSAGSPAGHHRHHRHRSVDPEETALYLTVDCRDQININVTPAAISVLQEVVKDFTSSPPLTQSDAVDCSHKTQKSSIRNLLGPESGVRVLEKKEENGDYEVVEESTGRVSTSTAVGVAAADVVAPLVDISPADSDSEMAGDENDGFMMSSSCVAPEKRIVSADLLYAERSMAELYCYSTKEKLSIQVEGFDPLVCLLPSRLTTTMYALQPVKNKTRYFVLVGVEMDHGQRTITVQSPLKVVNSLGYPVHVFCQKSVLEAAGAASEDYSKNPFQDEYIRLTTLAPEATYDVPLLVAYHCKLYFQPVIHDKEYAISGDSVWWKDMTVTQKGSKFLVCQAENDKESIFCTKVVCIENKNLKTPSVGTKLVPNFSVHLFPPVVLHNFLPLPLDLVIKNKSQSVKLLEGENITFHDIDPQQTQEILLEAGQYAGLQWHGKVSVCGDMEDQHPAVAMSPDADTGGGNRHLQISLHLARERGLHLYLFSPYWIVNKTGLPLQFRGAASDHVYDAAPGTDPLLFRFKKHRRKKAKLRVYSSQWSRSFSLDTAGNSGVVVCTDKERNKKYRFFVSIVMSELLLTKIVVVKPFFLVINNTENPLRFMEKNEATDLWFDIAQEKCLPFWPDTESSRMFVKHRDSKTVSQHFPIDHSHVTVLRMECGSAMKVEVKCSEDSSTTIAFSAYSVGDAPVRVDNFCEDLFLKIHQKCQSQVTLLNPYQSVLYTWDDPSEDRTLVWNLYNRKKAGFPARIARDGYGHEKLSFHTLRKTLLQPATNNRSWSVEESSSSDDDSESEDGQQLPRRKTRKDKVVVHWVSYVERGQRVLLFTQNDRVAKQARKAVDGERAFLECFLSLGGLGVSLVSDSRREVAFASLSGCPAIWEIEINHSWKLLTLELSAWLEDKWNADQQKAHLKEYLQVDLTKMQMIKPFFGQLRRFYSPALWLQLRKSPVQTYAHLKVHRFQVDNQLPDAVFPTVFHPGTTPQYVVRREGPKPWMESCVLFHNSKDRTTRTIKFCKVLMQEVHLKLDKGFLLSVHDIYSRFSNKLDENAKLRMDVTTMQKPLIDLQQRCSGYHKKILFEYIHLSPIKVHFSFSPRGTVHRSQSSPDSSLQADIVDLLLSSVGATLTEVKDVELRMAYFERRGHLSRPADLAEEVVSHYKSQTVQQAYVMVFGLDILGNPYGLVKDFTRGIGDFFYEPFLGSVKGPDEFASSLARGAQSLLGHVIGGSAGAVSLITGSLGQALSVLSFDEEYRKRRQLRLNQHPDTLPASLLSAARSFALGVALGLSGVVVQPVTGGQQEGVEGFFRGMGKGLLGLITKPAGGVMDMISMAFDGIRRAAEMGENVVLRMRLPRYIHPTEGLRPYSPYLSSGCLLLELVSKGHYAETDVYWAHASLSPHDRARVALLTDRHVFLLEKCRLWGGWDVEWVISVDDILTVPQRHGNNLVIKVKQEDWILNFAGDERFVQCDDTQVLDWLKDKIEKVLLFNMWDKPCSLKL